MNTTPRGALKRALVTTAATSVSVAVLLGPLTATSLAEAAQAPARSHVPAASSANPLELVPLQLPQLSGLGDIGSVLTATDAVWNLPGVASTIVWLRDGVPIPGTEGLWSYVPTDADAGHELAAQITGRLLGVLPVTAITNALGVPLPGFEASTPSATTPPTISGTPQVGNALTAAAPTWDADGVATTYQWLRDGVTIDGATAERYTVAAADALHTLTVRATGTRGGAAGTSAGTATSTGVKALLGAALTSLTPPSIAGAPKVGGLLTSTPGTWSGDASSALVATYQWARNGVAIPGATGSTYVPVPADAGKQLAVAVSGARQGYAAGRAASILLSVARMTSNTRAALVRKSVPKGTRGLMAISLVARPNTPAAGTVVVYDGTRKLQSFAVRPTDNGQRTVQLPALKPGTHRLTAVYAGSSAVQGSTSKVVTLVVAKK